MYEIFDKLCKQNGVSPGRVAAATGIARATLSEWKKGTYQPKSEKLQKIADYFGVSIDYLLTGKQYYLSEETAKEAQALFDDPDLRGLMSAARGCPPDVIKNVTNLLKSLKETNLE